MTDSELDQLGPIDYLVIEFPAGQSNFTGEVIEELANLVDAKTIRLIDAIIITKDAAGAVDATELADAGDLGPLAALEADFAEFLAEDDVLNLAAAMDPGSVAGVLVYENVWAAPFASAARRAGGQLIADGRIHSQAIVAALEAEAELEEEGV